MHNLDILQPQAALDVIPVTTGGFSYEIYQFFLYFICIVMHLRNMSVINNAFYSIFYQCAFFLAHYVSVCEPE
jgi:hypothetical protein